MKTTHTSKALAVCTVLMLVGGLAFTASGQEGPQGQQSPTNGPSAPQAQQSPTNGPAAPQAQQSSTNSPAAPQGEQKLLLQPPNGRVKYLMDFVGPFMERITTDADFAAKAKISKEQVAKLKSVVDKAKRQAMALMEKIAAADAAVGGEITGGHNKTKASALVKKEVELWGELADLFVNLMFDGMAVVSVEQFEHAASIAGMMQGPQAPNVGPKWANQGTPSSEPRTTPAPTNAAPNMGANQGTPPSELRPTPSPKDTGPGMGANQGPAPGRE